jgi:hypothetical protein
MTQWAPGPIPGLTPKHPAAAVLAVCVLSLCACFTLPAHAQDDVVLETRRLPDPPPIPSDFMVADVPNDDGTALALTWTAPEMDIATRLVISRSESPDGEFALIDTIAALKGKTTDEVPRGKEMYYRVIAIGPGGASTPAVFGPTAGQVQWFNSGRTSVATFTLAFFAMVLFFFWMARGGRKLYVRRIPGIDAIEEAVGRATEMGRPVLYVPGIQDIDDIQTMASLVILESVARMTAQYDTRIIVPTNYPVVMTLAQEMVKNGYLQAGRPDAYDADSVRYVTTEQFAYVAAVNGIMLRDRPAANIFMGPFFAESLILAETGYETGAIQVAGTANVHQLPFFVVACDYTLIGEELYAASAYLSKEPRLLSTLKGSDYMKVAIIIIVLVGSVLESIGIHRLTQWMTAS